MSKFLTTTLTANAIILYSAGFANAQEAAEQQTLINNIKNEEAFEFSFGVPDNPALALSGLQAGDITKLQSLNDFVITVPTFLSGEKAVGVDVSLYAILNKDRIESETFDERRRIGNMEYWLRRMQVGIVAREGRSDTSDPTKSTKSLLSLGAATTLLKLSDPIHSSELDVKACEAVLAGIKKLESRTPDDDAAVRIRGNFVLAMPLRINQASSASEIRTLQNEIERDRSALSNRSNLNLDGVARANADMASIAEQKTALHAEVKALAQLIHDYLTSPEFTPVELSAYIVDIKKNRKDCDDAIKNTLRFKPNWDVGAAYLARGSASNGINDLKSGGAALWSSLRYPLYRSGKNNSSVKNSAEEKYLFVGATGRAGFNEFATTGDMTTPEAKSDTWQIWGGVEYFSENWRVSGRYGYTDVNFNDAAVSDFSRNGDRWVVEGDLKLRDNLWLNLAYGEAQGTVEALQGEQLTLGLKFNNPSAFNIFGK